jgi:alcohol dehydrogenase class IV
VTTVHIPGLVSAPFESLPTLLSGPGVGFVTDAYLAGLPTVAAVMKELPGIESIVVQVGEPTIETVDALSRRLIAAGVETVVAFGGGSVIDTVKLASVTAATGTTTEEHLGVLGAIDASLDVVAIPTTSGSGAEVTRTSVVSRRGRKSWAWNDRLRPRRVLVDPELTVGLPRSGTIATGLDALVHALEASTSPDADTAAIASGSSAIEAILDALPAAVADGGDRPARSQMLYAALCAGFAIDRAGTGIGHGVGHALASMLPIPHGLAVAFGMWSCLEWGMDAASDRYARIDAHGSLHRRIAAMLNVIEFEGELRRWVTSRLDPVEFATELAREEHQPMCLNNARPVAGDDVVVVSEFVASAWNGMLG